MPTREGILARCGIVPPAGAVLRSVLGDAVRETNRRATARGETGIGALDAGCGRLSALARYRGSIARMVGVDIHEPPPGALPHLDAFVVVDVCGPGDLLEPETFDLVLSSFTVEHFHDPAAAFANLRRWLRPGGALVLSTVNRRHPFVAAYLGAPAPLRDRLQPIVKAGAADAHPLVGVCNDPAAIRHALVAAGFVRIEVRSVGHLARAWGRRWPTFFLGLAGDLLTRGLPGRRSTLVVSARVPGPADPAAVAPTADPAVGAVVDPAIAPVPS